MNILLAALFAAGVVADPSAKCVRLTAVSVDPGVDQELEFFLLGPGSDHEYETMFTTVADVGEIAAAFEKAGFPKGEPVKFCSFYPVGPRVKIEPDLSGFIADLRCTNMPAVVYAGGTRHADGSPVAATNMPLSVFAFYNLPQSLLQFDDSLDQSPTYGRFKAKKKLKKGEKVEFKFTLVPDSADEPYAAKFSSAESAVSTFKAMRERAAAKPLSVIPDFSPALRLSEAIEIAKALRAIDSPRTKVNGFVPGQFFYSSFLPLEAWKDRKMRLAQPVEIKLGNSPNEDRITVIEADWSDTSSTEPKLVEKTFGAGENVKLQQQDTCLVFASGAVKLGRLYELRKKLPRQVVNWYVYP